MKSITLKNGTRVHVSDEDHDRLSHYSWSQFANGRAYRKELIPRELRAKKSYRTILMHREIMGVDDARKVIFRDGDPANCTRENLVVKDPRFQPRQRARKGGSSQYRGVGWNKAKEMWQAFIRVNGKLKHLGFFQPDAEGEVLAAHAYDDAAIEHFGDLAIPNFPRAGAARRRPVSPVAVQEPVKEPVKETAPVKPRLVASAPSDAPTDRVAELFSKPIEELTPEDMEQMKAAFLKERYRGKLRRAG